VLGQNTPGMPDLLKCFVEKATALGVYCEFIGLAGLLSQAGPVPRTLERYLVIPAVPRRAPLYESRSSDHSLRESRLYEPRPSGL